MEVGRHQGGTVLVKDIDPDDSYYGGPYSLTDVAGTLFFTVEDVPLRLTVPLSVPSATRLARRPRLHPIPTPP